MFGFELRYTFLQIIMLFTTHLMPKDQVAVEIKALTLRPGGCPSQGNISVIIKRLCQYIETVNNNGFNK